MAAFSAKKIGWYHGGTNRNTFLGEEFLSNNRNRDVYLKAVVVVVVRMDHKELELGSMRVPERIPSDSSYSAVADYEPVAVVRNSTDPEPVPLRSSNHRRRHRNHRRPDNKRRPVM